MQWCQPLLILLCPGTLACLSFYLFIWKSDLGLNVYHIFKMKTISNSLYPFQTFIFLYEHGFCSSLCYMTNISTLLSNSCSILQIYADDATKKLYCNSPPVGFFLDSQFLPILSELSWSPLLHIFGSISSSFSSILCIHEDLTTEGSALHNAVSVFLSISLAASAPFCRHLPLCQDAARALWKFFLTTSPQLPK